MALTTYRVRICFLALGADKNYADRNEWTPILVAAMLGHTGCVQQLCQLGADINATNSQGQFSFVPPFFFPLLFITLH